MVEPGPQRWPSSQHSLPSNLQGGGLQPQPIQKTQNQNILSQRHICYYYLSPRASRGSPMEPGDRGPGLGTSSLLTPRQQLCATWEMSGQGPGHPGDATTHGRSEVRGIVTLEMTPRSRWGPWCPRTVGSLPGFPLQTPERGAADPVQGGIGPAAKGLSLPGAGRGVHGLRPSSSWPQGACG